MFWYTNVRKRKKKTVFLLILICFLSSSFFAQNFIQDNKSKDITTEESTFDSEILKELKASSYSQTFEDSGDDTDMSLHQSYLNTSFNTVVNTSIVNGNNFTLPSPTDANFNSSYIKFTVEDITAPNKTLIVEDDYRNEDIISVFNQYISFNASGAGYIENVSLRLHQDSTLDPSNLTLTLYSAGTDRKPLSTLGTMISNNYVDDSATSFYWHNVTNLHYEFNSSDTNHDLFYIRVAFSGGSGLWIDYASDVAIGDNNDESLVYQSNRNTLEYYVSTSNTVDLPLIIDFAPLNNTPKPKQIGLKIDKLNVSNTDWGSGYLESYNINGSNSGSLKYNVSADWWDVECNITQVQINYTKDDFQATTQFSASTLSSIVNWNVSRTINNFKSGIEDYLSINFTVPESWNYTTYQVFNGSPSKEMTSYSYNRSLGNGFREICITNGSNGDWYILIDSTNQINSIDTYVEEIPYTTMNYTNTVLFNTTLGSSIAQDDGLFNLSIYDPNSILNFTQSNSTFNSGTEIFLLNWTISNKVTDYGIFPVQLTCTTGIEEE